MTDASSDSNDSEDFPPSSRDGRLAELVRAWRDLETNPSAKLPTYQLMPNPYPGLRSFEPSEGPLYFGRQGEEESLALRLERHNVVGVLGGSGSGKSSLVLAGLLPYLKRFQRIPNRGGRWYLVDTRPGTKPTSAIVDAIWECVCKPRLDRRFEERALAAAFAPLGTPPHLTRGDPASAYRDTLSKFLAPNNGVLDHERLLDFANNALQRLDAVRSGGMQIAPANLLIVIDQFEEIFRDEVDPAEANAVIELVKEVHRRQPQGLFITFTMRSEEMHRCAEYEGLSAVVFDSSVQVELLTKEDDIRAAIVEPSRRVFESWGIPFQRGPAEACAPFRQELVNLLLEESQRLSRTLEHKPDSLPLLQHALHVIWIAALTRWEKEISQSNPHWRPEVLLEDFLCRGDAQPLQACLNQRADLVRKEAVAKVATNVGGDRNAAGAYVSYLLDIAFTCLARVDDRGRWIRRFATAAEIASAATADTRIAGSAKAWEKISSSPSTKVRDGNADLDKTLLIASALELFHRRGYIFCRHHSSGSESENLSREEYDVSHEALIRGWGHYQFILQQAKSTRRALIDADHAISTDPRRNNHWLSSAYKWAKGGKPRRAADTLRRVNMSDLAHLFVPPRWLGPAWAENELVEEWSRTKIEGTGGERVAGKKGAIDEAARVKAKDRVSEIGQLFMMARSWVEWDGLWPPIQLLRTAAASIAVMSLVFVMLYFLLGKQASEDLLSLYKVDLGTTDLDPLFAQRSIAPQLEKAKSIYSSWYVRLIEGVDKIEVAGSSLNQKLHTVLDSPVGRIGPDKPLPDGISVTVSCGRASDISSKVKRLFTSEFELIYTGAPGYAFVKRHEPPMDEIISQQAVPFDPGDKICVSSDGSLLLRVQQNGLVLYPLTVSDAKLPGTSDNISRFINIGRPVPVYIYNNQSDEYNQQDSQELSSSIYNGILTKSPIQYRYGSVQILKIPHEQSGSFLYVNHLRGINQPDPATTSECEHAFGKCERASSGSFAGRTFENLYVDGTNYTLKIAIAQMSQTCGYNDTSCKQLLTLQRPGASPAKDSKSSQLGARMSQIHIGPPIVKAKIEADGYLVLLDVSGKAWRYAVGWDAFSSAITDLGTSTLSNKTPSTIGLASGNK